MRPVYFFIFFISPFFLFGQYHDNVWLFGRSNQPPPQSDARLDFNFHPPLITHDPRPMILKETSSIISDADGNLLFYTNGKYIAKSDHEAMENGSGLNPGDYASDIGENFVSAPQGILSLPFPENPNKYILLHAPFNYFSDLSDFVSFALLSTTVDMDGDGGQGSVTAKNETVISDTTLWKGKLTATRHANGRDWWVPYNDWETNAYYKVLVSPDGAAVVDTQTVGTPVDDGLGQAVFSPDGSKYVVVNEVHEGYLQIFDFDRCSGELSNEVYIVLPDYHQTTSPGVAISPNSRFLYYSATDSIYQYDLWSVDIPGSAVVVGEYDGHIGPFANRFFLAQLAPDGKIYINVPSGSNYLHVIERPDEKGLACMFNQRGVNLGNRNGFSLPNSPNYRLGPIDGSPCDSLGIDNVPVARYRYDRDSMDYLTVEFTDLSHHEPAEWHWDFGDNETGQDTSPVHTFLEDGIYEVCLTVGNVNGEDTYCQTLYLGVSGSGEPHPENEIAVYPNPARSALSIVLPGGLMPKEGNVTFYDAVGKRCFSRPVRSGRNSLRLDGLPPGLYFYEVKDGGVKLKSGKLVRQ